MARAQRRAKVWLAKAHEDVERARDRIGLHLQEVTVIGGIEQRGAVPGLGLLHSCRHEGPPEESRPCTEQAEEAIRRAYRAWEADPSRLQRICEGVAGVADRSTHSEASAAGDGGRMQRAPEAASEFPPDLDPADEEGRNPAASPEVEATLPSRHPWRRATHRSKR